MNAQEQEAEPQPKARIFLVEDHPIFRAAVQQQLEGSGYTVIPTTTAEEALALMEVDPKPSLVVTDYNLRSAGGQLTGIDLARRLRTHEKETLRNIPIVLLSAVEDLDVDSPEILKELEIGYVDKNDPPEILLDLVDSRLKPQT